MSAHHPGRAAESGTPHEAGRRPAPRPPLPPAGRRPAPEAVPRLPGPPPHRRRLLANGMTVVAARRPVVPLAEIRLWVALDDVDPAQVALLAATLLSGTRDRPGPLIQAQLSRVGGRFEVTADRDRLLLRGSCLAAGLGTALEILAAVVTGACYPRSAVPGPRGALADQAAAMARAPEHAALVALSGLVYGDHPYADLDPGPRRIREVSAEQLRDLHARQIRPDATTLAVVGDVDPERVCEAVQVLLGGWTGTGPDRPAAVPPVPRPWPAAGRTALAHRADSLQSAVRVALPAVGRDHPDHPALRLANLVFGGYFSSRLVANLREDKGYAYAPASLPHEMRAGALTVVLADVAREATAGTVREIRRELDDLTGRPITAAELGQARRYAMGADLLALSGNAGLADTAVRLAAAGLGLDWVTEHGSRLADLTAGETADAAARYFASRRAVTLVLGDAPALLPQLAQFMEPATAPARP